MFGLWYIIFGLLTLFVIGLAIVIALTIKKRHYRKLVENIQIEIEDKWDKLNKGRRVEEVQELARQRDKLRRQRNEYQNIYDDTDPFIGWVIAVIAGALSICFLPICIIAPLQAQKEVNYFITQKEYIEMAIENGEELENIAITQEIIKQNEWLARAKASVETYGCFSMYYKINFSELTPIVISRE